jgi:peptide/nickel transport system permease protein
VPVARALADTLPSTLLLMGAGLLLAFSGGIALGAWQAARRGRPLVRLVDAAALVLYAVPDFWLALMALVLFAYLVPVFPAGGAIDPVMHDYLSVTGRLVDRLKHLALPALTLAAVSAAGIARYQRAAMLEVLPADFVRTARAKGLPERRVILRHALRNALVPVVTLVGLALPALLGGAFFVERVFAWPGMGELALGAIATRDYPLVTASVVVAGALVAAGSLLADLLLVAVDPRIRLQ